MIRLLLFISLFNGSFFSNFNPYFTSHTLDALPVSAEVILSDNLIPNPQFTNNDNCCDVSSVEPLTDCLGDWFNINNTPDFITPNCNSNSAPPHLINEAMGQTLIGGLMRSNESESLGVCLTNNMEAGKLYEFSVNLANAIPNTNLDLSLNFYGTQQCSTLENFAENSNSCSVGGSFQLLFSIALNQLTNQWNRQTVVFTAPTDIEAIFYATQCNLARNESAYILMDDLNLTAIDIEVTEICDNGIDDDNDGLVDIFDKDCDCQNINNLLSNGSLSNDGVCCDQMYVSTPNCLKGWSTLLASPDSYQDICRPYEISQREQLLEQSEDGAILGIGYNVRNEEIVGEGIYTCLETTLVAGETYVLSTSMALSQSDDAMPHVPTDRVSIIGLTKCEDASLLQSNQQDCLQLEQTIVNELANLEIPEQSGIFNQKNVSFTADQNYEAIALAFSCDLATEENRSIYVVFDYLTLTPIEQQVFSYEGDITQIGSNCEIPLVLHVPPQPNLTYQWYRNQEPISNATSSQLSLTDCDETALYQVYVSNEAGCFLTDEFQIQVENTNSEICDNGIDDNNNGLVDAFDPQCSCGETVVPEPKFNETFSRNFTCCEFMGTGSNSCVRGWQAVTPTLLLPTFFQSNCNGSREDESENLRAMSDNGNWVKLELSFNNGNMIATTIATCLDTPMESGEAYELTLGVGILAGVNDSDYFSIYGVSTCEEDKAYNVDRRGCVDESLVTKLADFTIPTRQNRYLQLKQTITPPEDISTLIIGFPCDLPIFPSRTRLVYIDAIDISTTTTTQLEINDTIRQVGTRCDEPIRLQIDFDADLQYQWYRDSLPIAGATSNVYNVENFDPFSNYHVFVSNANGCELIGPHQLNIVPLEFLEIDFLCEGDTHQFRDTLISDPGFYTQYVEGINGDCDTIVSLRLTHGEVGLFEFDVTICAGENHFFNNETLTETGIYEERVPYGNGCDSITRLNLLVLDPIETIIYESICAGESYTFNNEEVNASGAYQFTTTSSMGCDSTVILNLEVLGSAINYEEVTICPNSSYDFHGQTLTEAGTYQDTILSTAGCDSIITLQLLLAESVSHDFEVDLCDGMRFDFNGRLLETSGTYFDTLQAASGCDSAIMLSLNVYGEVNTHIEENICVGDSYNFNGQQLRTAGIYKDTLRAATFCDSIVTLQLSVLQEVSTNLSGRICNGESYNFHGEMLSQTGIYHDTLQTLSGCDSIVTLQLVVIQEVTTSLQEQICNGDNYNFNGEIVSTMGTYYDTLQTTLGCDSIITLELTVLQEVTTTLQEQICEGDNYNFNGETLVLAGTYHDTLINTMGCDSIITLELGKIEVMETQLTESICEGTVLDFNGQMIDSAGTYLSILTAADGCDSLVRLELSITTPIFSSLETQICSDGSYFFNDQNLTTEGVYQDTLMTTNGCDSIIELNLLVRTEIQTTFAQTICTGEVFEFNQQSFNSAGTYQDTLLSVAGCDSIVTLNLSVLAVNTTVTEATICANDIYLFNNTNLVEAGTYFDTLTTDFGCDSIISLQLNVLAEAVGDTTYAAIEFSESYEFQQVNYSQSGTYPHTLTDSNGCDSIVFLNLNVAPEPCTEPIDFIVETNPTNCLSATNGKITFLVSNNESPYLYSIDGGLTFQSDPQFNNLPHGSYPLLIEDADGCLSESIMVNVLVRDVLEIEFPSAYEIQLGDSLQLDTLYSNFAPAVYTWTAFQPISCDTCARPFFKPVKTTTYQLTVTDAFGCTASDEIEIFVDRQSEFYLPTAFSPNGDNINDIFNIGSRPNFIETIENFSIFNRWGELVFQAQHISPQDFDGWNGQFESQAAMQGVYVYMIEVKTRKGEVEMVTGEVALLR